MARSSDGSGRYVSCVSPLSPACGCRPLFLFLVSILAIQSNAQVRAKIEDPFERDAYRIFTKLAFPPLLPTDHIGRAEVEKEVDACLARLRADRLDLLQLHWWDFDDPRYLDVLHYLAELKHKGGLR